MPAVVSDSIGIAARKPAEIKQFSQIKESDHV